MKNNKVLISESSLFVYKVFLLSLLVVVVAVAFFFTGRVLAIDDADEVSAVSSSFVTVVLDAGHGGADGGASVGKVFEKDLNLEISNKISEFLSFYNVDVILTRSDDKMLADDSSSNKKRDDLFNRVSLVKKYDDPVFVSIHMNKFPQVKYKGLQVFFSPNNPYSESLALVIQNSVKQLLEPDNNRNVKRAESTIYVLDRLTCPSVIVECGFLSNTDDLAKLQDEEYQNKLAFVIANSIIEYINL